MLRARCPAQGRSCLCSRSDSRQHSRFLPGTCGVRSLSFLSLFLPLVLKRRTSDAADQRRAGSQDKQETRHLFQVAPRHVRSQVRAEILLLPERHGVGGSDMDLGKRRGRNSRKERGGRRVRLRVELARLPSFLPSRYRRSMITEAALLLQSLLRLFSETVR